MPVDYSQSGNIITIAGLVVFALGKFFNVTTTTEEATQVIAGILAVVGVIKQIIAHKKLGNAAARAGAPLKR